MDRGIVPPMSFSAQFIAVFVPLFIITDPFGNIGIFLTLTHGDEPAFRRRQALMGNIYAAILLLVFLFGGPYILSFLGVSISAVNLGGGLIVGAIGWTLVRSQENRKTEGKATHEEAINEHDISFCPLALPLIAGPGALVVVIAAGRHILESGDSMRWVAGGLGVLAAMVVSWACLAAAPVVSRCLGRNGMVALTKIIGFLLVCIAAQMVITGAQDAFGWHAGTTASTTHAVAN
jgi:multiple antibiotic resistance protein